MVYTELRVLATTASGGEVALVRDPTGRVLARKRVRPDVGCRPDLEERLSWEGEVLVQLGGGSHLIGCVGRSAAPTELFLEYAAGGSLADRLAGETPLAPPVRWHVFGQLTAAVHRIHAAGIVHRDLKPSNVLFTAGGAVRLIDLGVSARIGSPGTLGPEWEETEIGTLGYAAPEQLRDPRSATHPAADVYSLGVLLYEMLTGRLPYEMEAGEDERALRDRILHGRPVPPSERCGAVAAWLERVVLAAIDPDPHRRPRSVAQLAGAVTEAERSFRLGLEGEAGFLPEADRPRTENGHEEIVLSVPGHSPWWEPRQRSLDASTTSTG